MDFCQICSDEISSDNRCEAHLFPSSLVKELKASEDASFLVKLTDGLKKGFSRKGVYDDSILCRSCDNEILGPYDIEMKKALFSTNPIVSKVNDGAILRLRGVDLKRLYLFVVSTVWRFHVSNRPEAKGIDLQDLADDFCDMIKGNHVQMSSRFRVTLYQERSDDALMDKLTRGVMFVLQETNPSPYVRIVLPRGFVFLISLDANADWGFPSLWEMLDKQGYLRVPILSSDRTEIFQSMSLMIRDVLKQETPGE
jgi:hypothetical protein